MSRYACRDAAPTKAVDVGMTIPALPCQTPSRGASRVGDSGVVPPEHGESVFVADEAVGVLDTPTRMVVSLSALTACIQTTRYVGTVDAAGFLVNAAQHVEDGTLVDTLVLTVRAVIVGVDVGGMLGLDGLDVEVVLHRGSTREVSLGTLQGSFLGDWQNYELDVPIEHVRFPDDPCPGQIPAGLCGRSIVPQANEVSFVFIGSSLPVTVTVDWMSLRPKRGPDLAARPIMLVHGWDGSVDSWQPDSAWPAGLRARDLPFHIIEIAPDGRVSDNGAEITQRVSDLTERFGVERINIVAHSKGGVDAREHVRHHDDVEILVMIATPNGGTPMSMVGGISQLDWFGSGVRDMSLASMQQYNLTTRPNAETTYVTASGAYDSAWALHFARRIGPNDEAVGTASVESLQFPFKLFTYLTSVTEAISQGICAERTRSNHSCLLYRQQILDDVFPAHLALTPEDTSARAAVTETRTAAAPAATDASLELLIVTSSSGVAADGVTVAIPVALDEMSDVIFAVKGEPAALNVTLLTPSGSRIDAGTPASDPAVVFEAFTDLGPASFTGVAVLEPEPGTWTVEVTGSGGPSAEGQPYAMSVFAPLVPGVGVVLDARLEPPLTPAGQPVTIVATITEAGLPVIGATVRVVVLDPDGALRPEIVLLDDGGPTAGDGVYTGVFTDTDAHGRYDVSVTATRAAPAFTREQILQVTVTQGGTGFSGIVTDRGLDTDGDGLFDHLVVDVGVSADIAADYRLYGNLTDEASATMIEQLRVEASLEPGTASIPLTFDAARLSDLALDGPYLVTGLALEEVTTGTVVALGPDYTTAGYALTQFQRPPCVLTGTTADRGSNDADKPRVPFEELIVEVEVDLLAAAQLDATARLHAPDGTLIAVPSIQAHPPAGRSLLSFSVDAGQIFRIGQPGPYTLQELTVWGTLDAAPGGPTPGAPVSLAVPGVTAVTQSYPVEDFGPSPQFTVGGTVTGLVGSGLKVREVGSGLFGSDQRITRNGPFVIAFPRLFSGNPYRVEVTAQPSNPAQQCIVVNGIGTIDVANVSDVQVECQPPETAGGPA